jgi:hypothetical protein
LLDLCRGFIALVEGIGPESTILLCGRGERNEE